MTTWVLMPGLDGTGRLFEPLRGVLGNRVKARVIAYPKRQMLTYAQLLPQVQSRLPTSGSYLLVAESFSGPLALALAAGEPRGLVGVVLCNSFVRPPVWPGLRFAPLGLLARIPPPEFMLRRHLVGGDAPPALVTTVRQSLADVEPAVLAARGREVLRADARNWLAACPVPLLYLRGTADRVVPERCVREITELRPETVVARIPGPHLLLQASPQVCAEQIEVFLGSYL